LLYEVGAADKTIPFGYYTEEDVNGDGDYDDMIFIPYRKTGEYLISVVKEAEAAPDDKYTLVVSTETGNTTLAENVSVGDSPTYVFESTFCFDTGASDKPYPSIMGMHKGTIKPSKTIEVQKLYTYPFAGTAGHTESVRIYGNEIDESASWDGYTEDWDTITFDSPFTLKAGKTYDYAIETGSYPQIHHTDNLLTPAGFITCSEFRDVNGKRYSDWIPAIRLM